nr:solute carrier family 43 member 3 isoform X2 [Ciona intestinalis]|eukprot:XP_002130161.1 solute carrier family 43 member 3 isoform X2 [Ciona intestinalis]
MRLQHIASILNGCLECILFGGVIFGWPSLEYILKHEGYFTCLCEKNSTLSEATTEQCDESYKMFNLVFTIALALSQTILPFGGYVFDRFGTWTHRGVAVLLLTAAATCLALSTVDTSILLFPSMLVFAISGFSVLMSNIQLGNLAGKARASIITLLNGSFDSGTFVFLMFKIAHDLGLDWKLMAKAYAVFTILPWISTFILMPRKRFASPSNTNDSDIPAYGVFEIKTFLKEIFQSKPRVANQAEDGNEETNKFEQKLATKIDQVSEEAVRDTSEISLKQCLKSPMFWSGQFYFCLLNLRIIFFLGSFSTWLASFQSDANVSRLTDIFSILLVLAIFVSPANGLITDGTVYFSEKRGCSKLKSTWNGLFASTFATSLLAVLFSITVAFKQTYASFVLLVITRSFVYASNTAFVSIAFPSGHFGKLYGINNLIAGISGFLQYGLFSIGIAVDRNFRITNFVMILMSACTFVHSVMVYRKSRKTP